MSMDIVVSRDRRRDISGAAAHFKRPDRERNHSGAE
jgi:hypothetical protein